MRARSLLQIAAVLVPCVAACSLVNEDVGGADSALRSDAGQPADGSVDAGATDCQEAATTLLDEDDASLSLETVQATSLGIVVLNTTGQVMSNGQPAGEILRYDANGAATRLYAPQLNAGALSSMAAKRNGDVFFVEADFTSPRSEYYKLVALRGGQRRPLISFPEGAGIRLIRATDDALFIERRDVAAPRARHITRIDLSNNVATDIGGSGYDLHSEQVSGADFWFGEFDASTREFKKLWRTPTTATSAGAQAEVAHDCKGEVTVLPSGFACASPALQRLQRYDSAFANPVTLFQPSSPASVRVWGHTDSTLLVAQQGSRGAGPVEASMYTVPVSGGAPTRQSCGDWHVQGADVYAGRAYWSEWLNDETSLTVRQRLRSTSMP